MRLLLATLTGFIVAYFIYLLFVNMGWINPDAFQAGFNNMIHYHPGHAP